MIRFCASRVHCSNCLQGGSARALAGKLMDLGGDWVCPHGRDKARSAAAPAPRSAAPRQMQTLPVAMPDGSQRQVQAVARTMPTAAQIAAWASAALLVPRVSDEIRQERERICLGCPYLRIDPRDQTLYCSLCGCGVSHTWRELRNLAAFEEERDATGQAKRGCKHPQRADGKGWQR
jgi:hypothetical protein